MQDRFKFRIWDIKQQKYRQRTHHEADTCINCLSGKVLFGEGIEIYGEEDDKDVTLEQCTGLKDKNGKLIYENDIIRIDGYDTDWSVMVDSYGCWCICPKGNPIKGCVEWNNVVKECFYDHNNISAEVIGNIHENKELLDD